jgi:hypothetical protein
VVGFKRTSQTAHGSLEDLIMGTHIPASILLRSAPEGLISQTLAWSLAERRGNAATPDKSKCGSKPDLLSGGPVSVQHILQELWWIIYWNQWLNNESCADRKPRRLSRNST